MALSEKDFIGNRTICAEQGPFYGWNIGQKEAFLRVFDVSPGEELPTFLDYLKRQGFPISKAKTLEIGSSDGRNAAYLNLTGFSNVTGVDNNAYNIAQARRRCAVLGCKVNFQEFDLRDRWPYDDGSVDVIVDCSTTSCLLDCDRARVAQEGYRVLKPGGYSLFSSAYLTTINGIEQKPAIKLYTEGKVRKNYEKFQLIEFSARRKTGNFPKKSEYEMIVAIFQKENY